MKYELSNNEINIILSGLNQILSHQYEVRQLIETYWDKTADPKLEEIGKLNISIANIEYLIKKLEK